MSDPDAPVALEAYEALARRYSDIAETKAENGYNEHPAMRAQLGAVKGLRVVDAGCGPGFLTRYLLDQGAAEVAAFDISPAMIEMARERVGERAGLFVADLARPLPFLASAHFDLVASSLAIDYVRDWSVPLAEFRRALKPGGRVVMSVQHPMGAYKWYSPPSAFGVHLCEATWKGFGGKPVTVPDYYRSFGEIIGPILAAGFSLRDLTETRPVPELEAINPRKYHDGMVSPTFMILDLAAG